MPDQSTPQMAKQRGAHRFKVPFSAKPNRKARPIIVDRYIDEARKHVIEADLELSFIEDAEKRFSGTPPYAELLCEKDRLKMTYDYYMARLTYFKLIRDTMKSKEEARVILKEVEATEPEVLHVVITKTT